MLFQRAGFIKHAADAEIGLTRAYMQAGEYRRALAFAAHTAGAHPDSSAGRALYAQLLDAGGQTHIAARVGERSPLFAPYSPDSASLPRNARAVSSGVLLAVRTALVDASTLRHAERLWVRDGLGALAPASVLRRIDELDLAILQLDRPLGDVALAAAPRDPFPGSPAFAVGYPGAEDAAPVWPLLRVGFVGRHGLGIALPPGPRGGPVLDAAGRLVGLAVADALGRDRLLPVSLLKARFAELLGENPAAAERVAVDEIYERALATTLQVIVAR